MKFFLALIWVLKIRTSKSFTKVTRCCTEVSNQESFKNGRGYPMKAIKGHINGREVPTNPSRLHNLSGNISKLFGFITWLLFNILVSCSSTKRLFTPPKKMMAHQWPIKRVFPAQNKMMAHQKALPSTDGCPFAIKKSWFTIKLTSYSDLWF